MEDLLTESHNGHLRADPQFDHPPEHDDDDRIARFSSRFLDRGDSLIYAVVGICFFAGSLFTLGYAFWDFGASLSHIGGDSPQTVVATAIITLMSNLLLVLIIMEVLGTVVQYLKLHATSLKPFLFIGIISATRGILSIGARLSVSELADGAFTRTMIELGIDAAVILALGITLKLLGRDLDDR